MFSYKIRHQKIAENGSDCREDYWCSPAHPSTAVYIQIRGKTDVQRSGSPPRSDWTLGFSFTSSGSLSAHPEPIQDSSGSASAQI
ncbi:hypothetical protein QQF64_010617 [Cirrhinus molitorella]|uniref:Uncharacterized protein n=1 Tax=Cirrhinus molitorella TaxID=172907 RepID=A0ABR3M0Z6_9TELE